MTSSFSIRKDYLEQKRFNIVAVALENCLEKFLDQNISVSIKELEDGYVEFTFNKVKE